MIDISLFANDFKQFLQKYPSLVIEKKAKAGLLNPDPSLIEKSIHIYIVSKLDHERKDTIHKDINEICCKHYLAYGNNNSYEYWILFTPKQLAIYQRYNFITPMVSYFEYRGSSQEVSTIAVNL